MQNEEGHQAISEQSFDVSCQSDGANSGSYDVQVYSVKDLIGLDEPDKPYCVISITDPALRADQRPPLAQFTRATGILRLSFDYWKFSRNEAFQIWQFVQAQQNTAQVFLLHCQEGQVRSAAVGAAIADHLGLADLRTRLFLQREPNREMFFLLLEERKRLGVPAPNC